MNKKQISIFTIIICIAGACISYAALPVSQDIREQISAGEAFLQKGDFGHAAASYEKVLSSLDKEQSPGIYMDTLIRLAYGYKALGLHQNALAAFTAALPVAEKSNDPYRKALFFSNFSDIHLTLGDLLNAVESMKQAIDQARLAKDPVLLADILNNAGNMLVTDRNYEEAAETYSESLALLDNTGEAELKAKVLINMAYMESLIGSLQPAVLAETLEHVRTLPDSHAKAENYISLSLLMREVLEKEGESGSPMTKRIKNVWHCLSEARRIGKELKHPRMISQACGYLGQLYENEARYDEALRLTRRAVFSAQQTDCPEFLYLWQWQVGRLLKAQGHIDRSLSAYKTAIETLNPIRLQLFKGHRAQKDTFDKNVKPVYIGLADLYLIQADALQDPKSREGKLKKARDTMEILKTLELQNFFKDECVTYMEEKKRSLDSTPRGTAVVYPISLEDRLVVLLNMQGSMTHFNTPVGSRELKKTARRFRKRLQTRSSYRFLKDARKFYDWLIRPAETELAANKIDTLIIAPDGALRLIPFSTLNDGKQFLVEKYAVGTVPAIQLTTSEEFQAEKADILLGGLSDAVQEFTPLPGVKAELAEVKQIMNARDMLFNADFTVPNLTGEFKTNPFGILHLATHGVFGGSAKDSFLLTYNSRLDMDRLEELIGLSRFREQKVELLTLSACQTAMGNERAALGLAGVAVKAGVRTAIATLWFVDDEATSLTIREFYKQLRNPDLSKARALQNAQKKLIAQRRFWHPIYWGPFLLIGNWD
ncbi:CHAT domain-containing protein [Desulfobacterales bacterium HSG2]|nr:CHAT domain-containing protein [Desulfobacterales bacterium HSG2]